MVRARLASLSLPSVHVDRAVHTAKWLGLLSEDKDVIGKSVVAMKSMRIQDEINMSSVAYIRADAVFSGAHVDG